MKNYNKKIKGGNTPISMNDSTLLNSNIINNMSTEIMNRQFHALYSTTPTIVHSDSPPTTAGGARQKTRRHKKKISSKNKRNGKKRRTTRIY